MSTGPVRQIAYRLKADGGAEVKREFADIKAAGQGSYDGIAAASDRATSAAERAERRWRAQAEAARAAQDAWAHQAKFNAVLGVDQGGGRSARDSASVFEAEAEAMARAQAKAMALKAALDPLGAAQDRLNAELSEYAALAKRGVISTEQLAGAEALARKRFDETTNAIKRQSDGLSKLQRAGRLNLVRQGADVFTTGMMGMNPGIIAIQQGPQILEALAMSGFKASGALLGVGAAATLVGGAVVGLAVLQEKYSRSVADVEAAAEGLGRTAQLTGEQVMAISAEAAKAGEISRGAAREQAQAFLSTGVVGVEVLDRLIARGRDFQSTFVEDAEASTKRLAEAMADPVKAAETWGVALGGVDDKVLALIQSMVRQNDLTGAQMVLLDAVEPRLIRHADYVTGLAGALDNAARAASNFLDRLGDLVSESDSEKIRRLTKELPFLIGGEKLRGQRELAELQAEAARREKQATDNAAAAKRAREDAARRAAYGRVLPEDGRIKQLRADHALFLRDAADPKRSDAERKRASEAAAAAARDIEGLEKKKAGATRSSDRHARSLARETDSLEANAAGARAMADAYLKSAADGMKAEAARTAATRAAKNGADAELRTRQQLALAIAEQAAGGAKAVSDMRGEIDARKRLNDAVQAGTMSAEDAARALQLEAATRPLSIAANLAEGEAKTQLLRIIEALTQAYGDLAAQRAREAVLQDIDARGRNIDLMKTELSLLRATEEERAVGIARRQTELELDAKGISRDSPEGKSALQSAENEARMRARLSRGQFTADTARDQEDALELATRELAILRSKPSYRDQEIERLQRILELKRRGIDAESEEGQEILANDERIRAKQRELERARSAWDTIERVGSNALDRVGDLAAQGEDDWDAWKQAGLDAIREITAEFIKLWVLNPAKNALFGQNNPTLGDTGGILGAIFGGGGKNSGSGLGGFLGGIFGGSGVSVPGYGGGMIPLGFARGTESSPEGWAWVGEEGPELQKLPAGTRIKSHTSSMNMLRDALNGQRDGGGVTLNLGGISVDARGADADAAARIMAAVRELRRDIPSLAVEAVQDAHQRRILRLRP